MTFAPRVLLVAAAALALAACNTGTGISANLPIATDTLTAFALNGAPTGSPAGVDLVGHTVVPVTASFAFQVAFDVNSSGKIVLYPVQKVANTLSTTNRVGAQLLSSVAFDALTRAPGSGYNYDSTLVVEPNQTVALEIANPTVCTSILTAQVFYAKVVVTAVDLPTRTLKLVATTDPNCGFRSLTSGVPKD